MAANELNMKLISKDLKSFLTKEIENNAKKLTKKIIKKMDTKFEELRSRIETTDKKEEAAETLAKQNQNSVSNLTSESPVLQEELAEQAKKTMSLRRTVKTSLTKIFETR